MNRVDQKIGNKAYDIFEYMTLVANETFVNLIEQFHLQFPRYIEDKVWSEVVLKIFVSDSMFTSN